MTIPCSVTTYCSGFAEAAIVTHNFGIDIFLEGAHRQARPDIARERHLRDRDRDPAIADVMDCGHPTQADQFANKLAVAAFAVEIDFRRSTVATTMDDIKPQ